MSASIQSAPLPTLLRTLRVGMDDTLHIRRTVQLAAAKIEDLENQVALLAEELRRISAGRGASGRPRKRLPTDLRD